MSTNLNIIINKKKNMIFIKKEWVQNWVLTFLFFSLFSGEYFITLPKLDLLTIHWFAIVILNFEALLSPV